MSLLIAADGEAVGTIGLDDPNPTWRTAEVGFAVHPDHWNRGYATEAVALLTRYAVDERRLAKLYATAYEHNPASMRVLEKAGYEEEAVLDREANVGGRRVDCRRYAAHAEDGCFRRTSRSRTDGRKRTGGRNTSIRGERSEPRFPARLRRAVAPTD